MQYPGEKISLCKHSNDPNSWLITHSRDIPTARMFCLFFKKSQALQSSKHRKLNRAGLFLAGPHTCHFALGDKRWNTSTAEHLLVLPGLLNWFP